MRRIFSSFATAFVAITTATVSFAEPYVLDKSHTAITFQIDHLGFSLTHGRFSEFDAEIDFDADDPSNSSVVFTIDAKSIDTGWAKRDKHVRGPDFLNVEKNPEIVFKSTSIESTGDDTATMIGLLSLNGTSNEETFDVTLRKMEPSPFGRKLLTAGFVAETTIDRTEYGISYGAGAIGNEISAKSGAFDQFVASIAFDPEMPESASASFVVNTASIDLNDSMREGVLASVPWFNSEQFPKAEFRLTGLSPTPDSKYVADGVLKIKNVEMPVRVQVSLLIKGDNARAKGILKIDRRDFKLRDVLLESIVSVGETVSIGFDLVAKVEKK